MDRETFLASNRSLAEQSLAQRPRLEGAKLRLAAKYTELATLVTSCRGKQSRLGELKRKKRNNIIMAMLRSLRLVLVFVC